MALTLWEAAKLDDGNEKRAAIVEIFANASEILSVLPFENIDGNALSYNVEGALPGVSFRGVNEAFPESTGVINPRTESLVIAGGDLDVDRFIVQTQGQRQRALQEAMKTKALAHAVALKFIKGDSSVNPREFDGLQRRLAGTQVISNSAAAGGGPLSLAKLDEAIDSVTNPTHIFMNRSLRRRLSVAARTSSVAGDLQFDRNDFGRRVTVYNGLPVLSAFEDDGGDEVLSFTEAATGGGGSTASSVYVVSVGEGSLTGIQNGGIDVRDLGELDDLPVWRTRIEWYMSIGLFSPRASARLRDISDAAIVA